MFCFIYNLECLILGYISQSPCQDIFYVFRLQSLFLKRFAAHYETIGSFWEWQKSQRNSTVTVEESVEGATVT